MGSGDEIRFKNEIFTIHAKIACKNFLYENKTFN